MPDITRAPWTDRQVKALEAWQANRMVHSFTCGYEGHTEHVDLVPTNDGWVCPVEWCTYTQDWAHSFIFDFA